MIQPVMSETEMKKYALLNFIRISAHKYYVSFWFIHVILWCLIIL